MQFRVCSGLDRSKGIAQLDSRGNGDLLVPTGGQDNAVCVRKLPPIPCHGLRPLLSSRIQSRSPLPEISCQKNVRLQRNRAMSMSPAHSDGDIVKASFVVDTKVSSEENQKITSLTSTTTPPPKTEFPKRRNSVYNPCSHPLNKPSQSACYLPHT